MTNEETVMAKGVDEGNYTAEDEREVDAAISEKNESAEEREGDAVAADRTESAEEREHKADGLSNKSHLTSSVPRVARIPRGALSKGEMAEIRELLGDVDDAEIQRLYKRVTK